MKRRYIFDTLNSSYGPASVSIEESPHPKALYIVIDSGSGPKIRVEVSREDWEQMHRITCNDPYSDKWTWTLEPEEELEPEPWEPRGGVEGEPPQI